MLICEMFYHSQEVIMPGRFVFSFSGYAFTIMGMYMLGQPWRFRDLLFKATADAQFGKKLSMGIFGVVILMSIPLTLAYV